MKIAAFCAVMFLAGCASHTRLNPACKITETAEAYLVTVEHQQSTTHILLHDTGAAGILALNPVGARLFKGAVVDGLIQVRSERLYRGPDAATLLWGFSLWRMRDRADACWTAPGKGSPGKQSPSKQSAGIHLNHTPDGLELRRGRKQLAVWTSATPAALSLPAADITLRFQAME